MPSAIRDWIQRIFLPVGTSAHDCFHKFRSNMSLRCLVIGLLSCALLLCLTVHSRAADPESQPLFWQHQLCFSAVAITVLIFIAAFALLWLRFSKKVSHEVALRRQVEAALRESEDRFRVMSELTADFAYAYQVLTDGSLRSDWITGALSRVSGYSREDLSDLGGWIHLIHTVDLPIVHEQHHVLLGNREKTIEYRIRCKDGGVRWVLDHARPIWSAGEGRVVAIEGAVKDITARKAAEEALRKSEERFKLAMAANQDGLWDWDVKTDEVYFSPGCAAILGYPTDCFPPDNCDWRELIHPKDKALVLKANRDCIDGHRDDIEIEFRMRAHSGDWRWVLDRGTAVARDSNGSALRLVGTYSDNTARRRADQELRTSEEKYRRIYENSIIGFYQSTPAGRFVSANPAFAKMLGYDSSEDLLANISDITGQYYVNSEDRRRFQDLLHKVGMVEGLEYQVKRKDGANLWVASSARAYFDAAGEVVSYEGIVMDITRRKKAEKEAAELQARLHRSQKMESIGVLAGGIAHDFNNILAAIMGYTELSLEDVPAGTLVSENLKEILTGCMRARDLIKQILIFARQSDEALLPIRIDPIAKEVLKLIRSTTPVGIEIQQHIATTTPIAGNPAQIHQILMNLCTNSVHAMEATGGVMSVDVTSARFDQSFDLSQAKLPAGEYLKIVVTDTGSGISADVIDHIFDPFFTTKEVGVGTGMGLAVVHGIVETYGGQIAVESEVGRGTRVSVFLPASSAPREDAITNAQTPVQGSERILFLDDEVPIAFMCSQMLKRLGYTVTTRTNSVEALDLFRSAPYDYDLIITDMSMPQMNGDVLASRLLAIRPDIPIILCTGYSKQFSEKAAREIGIRAYIYKPVTKADLAHAAREVLTAAKRRSNLEQFLN